MGFTPWPYAATVAAVNDTYAKINANGDIVAHHLDSGIPWQEALDGTPYPSAVESEIAARVSNTAAGKKVYLAISPLNTARTGMADYWNNSGSGQPLPAPWNGYGFTSTEVQTAYINFATDLITRFNPEYFNLGIEASELILNDAKDGGSRYSDYLSFVAVVAPALKTSFPNLKLMVSVGLKYPGTPEAQLLETYLPSLVGYVDVVGASVYPYAFFGHANAGDPANLPANWLSQLQTIAGSKPVAVAETGWIAENLVIPSLSVNVSATADNQAAYVQALSSQAQAMDAKFVIWFSVVDFVDLWTNALGQDPIAQIWRDTGLYDGTVAARPALTTWQKWYGYSLTP
ncbi:MAG: hypothetical protein KJ795_03285 [Gammaproteobacteria bacterium]|nr:hypothetical protein [Gammaproteobacteria bacterium]MBU1967793.1 hypothetical protein [Gammaproteobacteria bacterium]